MNIKHLSAIGILGGIACIIWGDEMAQFCGFWVIIVSAVLASES